jgi:hypothetical protein
MRMPAGLARGAIDSGAALAALWYSEDECNDTFAIHVAAAIRQMLRGDRKILWKVPPLEPLPETVLIGNGTSPSIVWHAQAVGALLEVGFHPSAECVRHHLLILRERLRSENANHPGAVDAKRDHWILRTRHVAWVLACLAEMRRVEQHEARTPEEKAGLDLHEQVLKTAYSYLTDSSVGSPAEWLARQPEEQAWTEYWGGRGANLLNTLYVLLGICRADRHGFGVDRGHPYALQTHDVENLIVRNLDIMPTSSGLVVRLRGDWNARWTEAPLPAGVIGLIVLVLLEYAALLNEQSPVNRMSQKAAQVQLTAQRLARHLSATIDRWWRYADAFLNTHAEGTWFVPSYSVCLRAMLDSAAVDPPASVVAHPFTTISSGFARAGGRTDAIETWADITRGFVPDETQKEYGHALVPVPVSDPTELVVTPAGLHAAVMAHTSLRRAWAREDPRVIVRRFAPEQPRGKRARKRTGTPKRHFPRSPFSAIRLERGNRKTFATVRCPEIDPTYEETAQIGQAHASLIHALAAAKRPLTLEALIKALHDHGWQRTQSEKAVTAAVDELNKRYAMRLITSDASTSRTRYYLTARMTVATAASDRDVASGDGVS